MATGGRNDPGEARRMARRPRPLDRRGPPWAQPLVDAVVVVLWTAVATPMSLLIAFSGGVSLVSVVVAAVIAVNVLLAIYAVPALMDGRM
jgi:hypothetical protein